MTADDLTRAENRLFARLLARTPQTFGGKLYRDGVPRPDVYLQQAIHVVFVFREPNLGDRPCDVDMCAEVRDPLFRQSRNGLLGEPGRRLAWWNNKVGSFGHAVRSAINGTPPKRAFAEWEKLLGEEDWRAHDFLFPFGFVQIKKVGGGGTSNDDDIEHFARDYADVLREQLALYQPDLVIACGRGGRSPAKLLRKYVLTQSAAERWTRGAEAFGWWRFDSGTHPTALLEAPHPSARGSREARYIALLSAVREVVKAAALKA